MYRRPVAPTNVVSALDNKKATATTGVTKGLTSVIEDHQRRGEVLRKQQQLLAKQLADIQVGSTMEKRFRAWIDCFTLISRKRKPV